ncbi:hypothetical protein BDK51DRAFT_27056 [Blyttiomyces helicus]|uniref:Uncharacterized protein n=1 Tax=Blyttiomyces helicus TaxID=388810 RepID=A0A4P9WAS5_9FUNG|nr:hypothetical protein BDK51DRAFT_27056 [Blyttiomyces helicus]|eukprot:RKO87980.1 hypothetical protein BDK51DRAFT_27056 [Blyttiomyces helicus]
MGMGGKHRGGGGEERRGWGDAQHTQSPRTTQVTKKKQENQQIGQFWLANLTHLSTLVPSEGVFRRFLGSEVLSQESELRRKKAYSDIEHSTKVLLMDANYMKAASSAINVQLISHIVSINGKDKWWGRRPSRSEIRGNILGGVTPQGGGGGRNDMGIIVISSPEQSKRQYIDIQSQKINMTVGREELYNAVMCLSITSAEWTELREQGDERDGKAGEACNSAKSKEEQIFSALCQGYAWVESEKHEVAVAIGGTKE